MEQEERVLLKERDAIEKHSVRNTKLVILLGSLLAFSIVPIAAFVTNREIQKRAVAERETISKTEKLVTSERESRRKSQILQSVLDSMGDGVAVADEKGSFILFNSAAEKILGFGATSLPRQEWSGHYGIYLADGVTPVPPLMTFPSRELFVARVWRTQSYLCAIQKSLTVSGSMSWRAL